MDYFLNELSLENAFESQNHFEECLKPFIEFLKNNETIKSELLLSNKIRGLLIYGKESFYQCLCGISDRDYKVFAFSWLDKSQYWESERSVVEDDYFEYKSKCVTDFSLGEAARKYTLGEDACIVSSDCKEEFCCDSIDIVHGFEGNIINELSIGNIHNLEVLSTHFSGNIPEPRKWPEFIEQIRDRYGNLIFHDNIIDALEKQPLDDKVIKGSGRLLGTLDKLVEETNEDNSFSPRGQEIYNKHFVGEKAWFTAESETNKNDFKEKLTFTDPSDSSKSLFCHFHGKIKTPQYRIHFEWERPPGQRKIKVVYIGPKITKK